jgi:hypothetical protein
LGACVGGDHGSVARVADEKGKMRRVAEVWLQWARENGYAW